MSCSTCSWLFCWTGSETDKTRWKKISRTTFISPILPSKKNMPPLWLKKCLLWIQPSATLPPNLWAPWERPISSNRLNVTIPCISSTRKTPSVLIVTTCIRKKSLTILSCLWLLCPVWIWSLILILRIWIGKIIWTRLSTQSFWWSWWSKWSLWGLLWTLIPIWGIPGANWIS